MSGPSPRPGEPTARAPLRPSAPPSPSRRSARATARRATVRRPPSSASSRTCRGGCAARGRPRSGAGGSSRAPPRLRDGGRPDASATRSPELAGARPRPTAAGPRGLEPLRRAVDGVALGHGSGPQHGPPRPGHEARPRGGSASRPTRPPARRRSAPPRAAAGRPRAACAPRVASSATRSHSSSGSRSGSSVFPPRSTNSAASPPSSTTVAPATRAARPVARFGQGRAAPYG